MVFQYRSFCNFWDRGPIVHECLMLCTIPFNKVEFYHLTFQLNLLKLLEGNLCGNGDWHLKCADDNFALKPCKLECVKQICKANKITCIKGKNAVKILSMPALYLLYYTTEKITSLWSAENGHIYHYFLICTVVQISVRVFAILRVMSNK